MSEQPLSAALIEIGKAMAEALVAFRQSLVGLGRAVWKSPETRRAMRTRDSIAPGMYSMYAQIRKNQAARRHRA